MYRSSWQQDPHLSKQNTNPRTATPKHHSEMSLDELREAANHQGLEYYKQQYEADPSNEQAKAEYFSYCEWIGHNPDPEVRRLYEMDNTALAAEGNKKARQLKTPSLRNSGNTTLKSGWQADRSMHPLRKMLNG